MSNGSFFEVQEIHPGISHVVINEGKICSENSVLEAMRELAAVVENAKSVIIDLAQAGHASGWFFTRLYALQIRKLRLGQQMILCCLSSDHQDALRVTHVGKRLVIRDNVEEALRELQE